MPVPPAELTAEFSVAGPDEARAAARAVADPSGLAREDVRLEAPAESR